MKGRESLSDFGHHTAGQNNAVAGPELAESPPHELPVSSVSVSPGRNLYVKQDRNFPQLVDVILFLRVHVVDVLEPWVVVHQFLIFNIEDETRQAIHGELWILHDTAAPVMMQNFRVHCCLFVAAHALHIGAHNCAMGTRAPETIIYVLASCFSSS